MAQPVVVGAFLEAKEQRPAALQKKCDALAQIDACLDALKGRRADLGGQIKDVLDLGAAFWMPVKAAVALETAQVKLGGVINATTKAGETQAQARERSLQAATRQAVAFSNGGTTTAVEMLEIQYVLNSSGLDAEIARVAGPAAAKAATVVNAVPGRVAGVMATIFDNVGVQMEGTVEEKAGRIGDLLTRTQSQFHISGFDQLGESMEAAAPAIGSHNVALEQSLVLLGSLNKAGLQGSEAGAALSAALKQMSKAAGEFGFDLVKTEEGQLDVIATLENMKAAVGGFGEDMGGDVAGRLQTILGPEGAEAIRLLGKEIGNLRQDQEKLAESSRGFMDASYQSFVQSSAGQIKIFENNVDNAAAAFGSLLLPGLNAVIPPLVSVVQFGARLAEKCPILTTVVMGAAVGMAALRLASLGLSYAWTVVAGGGLMVKKAVLGLDVAYALATGRTTVFAGAAQLAAAKARLVSMAVSAGGVIKGVKGFGASLLGLAARAFPVLIAGLRLVGVAFMSNPIGLVIGAVALAAGILIGCWGSVGPFFKRLWGGIGDALGVAWRWIKTLFSWTPLGLVIKNWGAIKGWIGGLWSGIVGMAGKAWDGLKTLFSWTPLGLVIKNWGAVKGWVGGLWSGIVGMAGKAWDGLKTLFSWTPLGLVIKNWGAIKGWVGGLWSGIVGMAGKAWDGLKTLFSWTPLGLVIKNWGAIKGWVGGLWSGIVGMAGKAWDGLKTLFSWTPLGLVIKNWGAIKGWVGGLWSGIVGMAGKAWDGLKTLFSWTPLGLVIKNWGAIKGWVGGLWSGIVGVAGKAWDGLKTLFSWTPLGLVIKNWGAVKGWIDGLWDGIMEGVGKAWDWIKEKILAPIEAVKNVLGAAWKTIFGSDDEASRGDPAIGSAGSSQIGAVLPQAVNDNAVVTPPFAHATGTDVSTAAVSFAAAGAAAQSCGNVTPLRPQQACSPISVTATITINAAPGMDEKALARQVKIALQDAMREADVRRRAANYD